MSPLPPLHQPPGWASPGLQARSVASAEHGENPEGSHGALATLLRVAWPGLTFWVVVLVVPTTKLLLWHAAFLVIFYALALLIVVGPIWAFMVRRKDVSRRAKVTSLVVNFSPAVVVIVRMVVLLAVI